MRTGLRDVRFVIFDNGNRMLFATAFETDWDTYIDDVVLVIGMPYFIDGRSTWSKASESWPGPRRRGGEASNWATPSWTRS